ncbi:MAG: M23 family metallopeptidase [Nitriliruptoraceae bacterium]
MTRGALTRTAMRQGRSLRGGTAPERLDLSPLTRAAAGVVAVALIVVGHVITTDAPAMAAPRSSEEIKRDLDAVLSQAGQLTSQLGNVRQRIGSTEEQLAALAIRLEDARVRLNAAEGQVTMAEAALVEAEAARDRAIARYEVAIAVLADTEEELAFEESRLVDQIVDSFKYGSTGAQRGSMVIEVVRRSQNPNDFAVALKQVRTVIEVQDATVSRVTDLRAQQAEHAEAAASARERADEAFDEAEATLGMVELLRAEAASVADEIAADESRQRTVLASLRGTASETQSLIAGAQTRERQLREELELARARERGESDRSGFRGWAGGPDIPGAVCPVEGARAGRNFINDWGYPRWPGRWHQGNDIFASRGTPVVAVADAVVVRWNPPSRQTSLGGITVTYRTADGSEWYNAHLDTIASGIEPGVSVSRGQQIGTVGNTGNARTTPPHLHLGRRYQGSAVNPWPTVRHWC